MRISRLYFDQNIETDSIIELPSEKAHYVSHVLRLRKNDSLIIFNGTEHEFDCRLIDINKKSARIEIIASRCVNKEALLNITLALGISRSQHMDYAIQKAVELGVTKIVPLTTEFSNVRLQDERINNKLTHWNNIIINATEQCGRTKLARLTPPQLFKDWICSKHDSTCLILHPEADSLLDSISIKDKKLCILVGPEGGFSDTEIKLAKDNGIIAIKLGPRILRTETAVVTILSIAQQLWGDFS